MLQGKLVEAGVRVLRRFLIGGCHHKTGSGRRQNAGVQELPVLGQGGFPAVDGDFGVGHDLPAERALLAIGTPGDFILNQNAAVVAESGSALQRVHVPAIGCAQVGNGKRRRSG